MIKENSKKEDFIYKIMFKKEIQIKNCLQTMYI